MNADPAMQASEQEAAQDYVWSLLTDELKRLRQQAKTAPAQDYRIYEGEAEWVQTIMDEYVLVKVEDEG